MNAFDTLRDLVFRDPDLQQRLIAESNPHKFLQLVVHLSHQHGCGLTQEQAQQALMDGKRAWLERKI